MIEKQNIDFKRVWKDDYLMWVCGFANAQGGTLYIGKDDDGTVIGLDKVKHLMEVIPNKITSLMGIVADVNHHIENGLDYIEIVVEPQPNPVSCKGEYHYRSGSTKQELRGAALDKFILEKYGKKWDSVAIPRVSIDDLKQETFELYKNRGVEANRLDESCKKESNQQLLENLKLMEGGLLKRAALLLFHPDPETFVTGAYIKIGYFKSQSDLLFQDTIHGNLFEQVEKTMELLLTKYTKALVSYDGLHRFETYEYPKEALREAILNSVSHKIYEGCTPIQIRVYPDMIKIWNEGRLPENWSVEDIIESHSSRPYNPDIANAFFRSGYVESWGRGISKMEEKCIQAGLPKPIIENKGSDFWITFKKDIYNEEYLSNLGLNQRQVDALIFYKNKGEILSSEYIKRYSISERTARYDLSDLVEKSLLTKIGENKSAKYIYP